mgnify:CR=1 FL=1
MKLVSIIIPTKNREKFIKKTIDSVLSQSYKAIEILIVDDGSTDNTKELVLSIKSALPIYFFQNDKSGAPSARNFGIKKSKGEFIQFLDSDDILQKDKIFNQVKVLTYRKEIDLTYSKAQFFNENGDPTNEFWGQPLKGNYLDYFNFSFQTMCPLYRKSALNKFGHWDEELTINQDWEFSLRYIIKGALIYFEDRTDSYFRQHDSGNIGDLSINEDKIWGKFLSSYKIWLLLIKKEKMSPPLKLLFYKRWIYTLLLSSSVSNYKLFSKIMLKTNQFLPCYYKPFFFLTKSKILSNYILNKY